jgi:hypothetical protein
VLPAVAGAMTTVLTARTGSGGGAGREQAASASGRSVAASEAAGDGRRFMRAAPGLTD